MSAEIMKTGSGWRPGCWWVCCPSSSGETLMAGHSVLATFLLAGGRSGTDVLSAARTVYARWIQWFGVGASGSCARVCARVELRSHNEGGRARNTASNPAHLLTDAHGAGSEWRGVLGGAPIALLVRSLSRLWAGGIQRHGRRKVRGSGAERGRHAGLLSGVEGVDTLRRCGTSTGAGGPRVAEGCRLRSSALTQRPPSWGKRGRRALVV